MYRFGSEEFELDWDREVDGSWFARLRSETSCFIGRAPTRRAAIAEAMDIARAAC
jgi:hypothetical protein